MLVLKEFRVSNTRVMITRIFIRYGVPAQYWQYL